ncbi:hypothetical protein C0Q70_07388 [Pomacea canaliculata]|uniref:Carbohydrate sulfotransferase n=1 Tax=Pomacea canaliculata TaxID=400727 RepID=A0A2T7PEW7_POMCA|nr:hypothetical protein C0Q70_07388 [Pomacea canaliculata]
MRISARISFLLVCLAALFILFVWVVYIRHVHVRANMSTSELLHERGNETLSSIDAVEERQVINTTMAPNLTYVTQEPKDVTHRSAYDEILALPDRNESIRRLFETHDVSNESYSLLYEYHKRVAQAHWQCPEMTPYMRGQSKITGVFTHAPSRVAYCYFQKIILQSKLKAKNAVHSNRHSHGQKWEAVAQEVQDYMRFVFVRHPFSRLWSAYLDKLYLPDLWRAAGVTVVAKLRNSSATAKAKRCGNDVTFREFLEYSLEVKDLHWDPIFQRCDPCTYRPTVIGNIETFERDSLFVLRRMGMEWVLKHLDQQAQVEQELSTLIVYNFDILHSRTYYQGCLDDDGLARRLWATFQMNGYIPNDANYFPPCANGTIANDVLFVDSFLKQVLDTVRKAYNRKDELKEQKRRALHDAFDAVSNTLLEKLLAKYQLDMLLFGFNEHDF